jgi:molybdate transport system substrate-binding protein
MEIARLAVVVKMGALILFAQSLTAEAAEVILKVADPLTAVIKGLGPQFERETGHKLIAKFTPGPVVKRDIDAGEAFDLAISITPVIDALIKERKIVAGTRADVGYSGVGVGVRAGAPKPDISSVEAFKRALLNANSVAFAAEGASGTYFRNLVERLGISEQMKTKLKPLSFDALIKAVPSGEAEMVVITTSIIVAGAAELVGPVPTELQFYNSFAGGVGIDAKQADIAKEFIKFVTGPAAVVLFKANGMEPGVPRPGHGD